MVYAEEHASLRSAIAREHQVKHWTARKKEALVAGDPATLKALRRQHEPGGGGRTFTWKDMFECGHSFSRD